MLNDLKQAFSSMVGGAASSIASAGAGAGAASSDSGNGKFIMYAVVAIIFLGVSYWAYTTYVGPLFSDFNLNVKQGSSKTNNEDGAETQDLSKMPTAEIYLFKADWCPHCKRAVPIFNSVKSKYHDTSVNGHRVIFRVVDCDAEPALAEKFNIEGYPTIKMVKDGEVIEFDAKPEEEAIVQFMNTVI
jgi:thiol-disulfide isomerase/thioredoxin